MFRISHYLRALTQPVGPKHPQQLKGAGSHLEPGPALQPDLPPLLFQFRRPGLSRRIEQRADFLSNG